MQKTKQTGSRLLVIAITTAAIIAMTTTTSLSAATPAFAKFECTDTSTGFICTGGQSNKAAGADVPGGSGGRTVVDFQAGQSSQSGGNGGQIPEETTGGTLVGGAGGHSTCDNSGCTFAGGGGVHLQGRGGNSGSAPPR